ncbi:NUDIX domain-containing protein [Candidatus Falkowbacteria bacterium]|jgi:8-oxo-dGTP diphosphatase|nr:NUDIX domain-containing protein [Candidatus Falkowbacteria bacterium]MBT7007494.1 NUDIX domain-containing protein [Candidatus Falkowbacteria bacterium]
MTQRYKLPVAAHLFLIKDNKILLHLRKNSSFENMYGVIAGHLDGGESAIDSIIREAKEEANIDINRNDLKIATVSHSNANNNEYIQFFFFCDKWDEDIKNMELDKCSKLTFFPINELPENIVPYIRKAIGCAMENITYFELGW